MEVSYFGALIAGLISFLSPCVLPLVPPYLCFLGGVTMEELTGEEVIEHDVYGRVVLAAVFFVLGFSSVFIALGATATLFGQLLAENLDVLAKVSGALIILLGLHFLGFIKIPLLHREVRYHAETRPAGLLGAYFIGLAFAFGWTPCIGPVLAAILFIAASEQTIWYGTGLLAIYSLGLGIPFIAAAVTVRPFLGFLKRFRGYLGTVERVMGGLLVLTGILFITGSMSTISYWMLELFPGFATIG